MPLAEAAVSQSGVTNCLHHQCSLPLCSELLPVMCMSVRPPTMHVVPPLQTRHALPPHDPLPPWVCVLFHCTAHCRCREPACSTAWQLATAWNQCTLPVCNSLYNCPAHPVNPVALPIPRSLFIVIPAEATAVITQGCLRQTTGLSRQR